MSTNNISLRSIRDCIQDGIPYGADRQRIVDFLDGMAEQAKYADGKVSGDTKTQSERDRENTNGSLRRKSAVTAMLANGFHWTGKEWVKTEVDNAAASESHYRDEWHRVTKALHGVNSIWSANRTAGVTLGEHAANYISKMGNDLQRFHDKPDYSPHYLAWVKIIGLLNERSPGWDSDSTPETFAEKGIAALRNLTKPESPYGRQALCARFWDNFAKGFSEYFPSWMSESNAENLADRALNVIGALRGRIAKHEDKIKSLDCEREQYRAALSRVRSALDKASPGWIRAGLNTSIEQDMELAITKLGESAKANESPQSPSYAFCRVVDELNRYTSGFRADEQYDIGRALASIQELAHAKPSLTNSQCSHVLEILNRWAMSHDARTYGMPLGVSMDEGIKTLRNALETV